MSKQTQEKSLAERIAELARRQGISAAEAVKRVNQQANSK